jgi:thiamine-monophosphate kinase
MARPPRSEWALVEILKNELTRGPRGAIRVDIGDDASVLRDLGADLVLSVDASVENVHFRRRWARWDVLAARAFEAALSDLAAMGSEPVTALSAMALPVDVRRGDVTAMARGLARAARRARCPIAGGNVTRATEVSFTTTVIGTATRVLTRDGARVGDDVFVTGPVGGAALGLACLESAGRPRGAARFVARLLAPRARIAAGRALAGIARACIDLSDGLVSDLGHVAEASGVRIEIDPGRLPRLPGHDTLAARLGVDGTTLALTGGEDYELAFTAKRGAALPIRAFRIGRVVRGDGVTVLGSHDALRGHDHFR